MPAFKDYLEAERPINCQTTSLMTHRSCAKAAGKLEGKYIRQTYVVKKGEKPKKPQNVRSIRSLPGTGCRPLI